MKIENLPPPFNIQCSIFSESLGCGHADKRDKVSEVCAYHNEAHPLVDAAEKEGKEPQEKRSAKEHRDVEELNVVDLHGANKTCSTKDEEDVENVAADNISHSHIVTTLERCNHAGCQLRGRGATCKDGKADDGFADTELISDVRRGINEDSTAHNQQGNAGHNLEKDEPAASLLKEMEDSLNKFG